MYLISSNFGQIDTDRKADSTTAENITAIAKLTAAIIGPAAEAYAVHARSEINEERIKAGLPPLPLPGVLPPPPEKENFAIGGIALLIIIFLVLFKS